MTRFGPFHLDPASERLTRDDGVEIRLRPKTFAVLRYLLDRPGRLITKDEILTAIWAGTVVTEAALTVCLGEIRLALGDDARAPRYVETVHRRGFRWVGTSEQTPAAAARTTPIVVGRVHEVSRLHGWLDLAMAGARQVGFVAGDVGLGKTTVVDAFVDEAVHERGVMLLRGQCVEQYGAGEAYLPVLDAIARRGRERGSEALLAVLRRHAATWLAETPSLLQPTEIETFRSRAVGATRHRMLREMTDALEALSAERPVVLVLEDLHWSDHSTLDLLAYLARRRDPARLLVIGTYRPVDVIVRAHPLKGVKQELELHRLSHELPLELLTEADVAEDTLDRPLSQCFARTWLSWVHHLRGEGPAAERAAQIAMTLSQEHGFPQRWAQAAILKGAATGDASLIRTGLDAHAATGARTGRTHNLGLLAEAELAGGQIDAGLTAIEEAFELVGSTGERWWEAELHRLRGELHRAAGRRAAAETCVRTALDIARRQGARALELRAERSL